MPAATAANIDYNYVQYNPLLCSRIYEDDYTWANIKYEVVSNTSKKFNAQDKEYIRLEKLLKAQLREFRAHFEDISFMEINHKFSQSCSALLELNPDILSLELTSDESILYTFKKKEYILFAQHYLNELDEDEDEMIISAYKNNQKLPSYAGSLNSCLIEINNIFEGNNLSVELPLNEVSF